METVSVSGRREFIDEVSERDLPISKEGADELWSIWEYRHRHGADEDYLIFIPKWMAESDFERQWPYLFAAVEYDDESKGAVLFRDARMISPSIVENQVWSEVSISDVLERVDLSDTDFVDEPGKTWISREHSTVFEMGDDDE